MNRFGQLAGAGLLAACASAAFAQSPREGGTAGERAGQIVTEPARDVGLQRTQIPSTLERAAVDPYSLAGVRNCPQIRAEVAALNRVLGTDFDAPPAPASGSRGGRIAEAGGRAVVNSIIPFRGVIRELSGSAEADRRMQAAVDAGIARRGFLRGLAQTRGCR
jgi:hypothetical protein